MTEQNKDPKKPSVAAFLNGGFVVVWASKGQNGSNWGIYAQRYDAAGSTVGGEFRVKVNIDAANDKEWPRSSVAAFPNGGFVVMWDSWNQDGSGYGVYAQRYDAAGSTVGAEFKVNTYTANSQARPSVAAFPNGGFVVAWKVVNQDGSGWGIYAQRYDAAGTAVGAEFKVNTYTANEQWEPSVAAFLNRRVCCCMAQPGSRWK